MALTRVRSEFQLLVRGVEVHLDGVLIGAVVPVPVPGQEQTDPFNPACQYVGWAHDWIADDPQVQYTPKLIGANDDPEILFDAIALRARQAQL